MAYHSSKRIYEPRRILWLLAIAAAALVLWTVWIAHTLPPTHLDRRWEYASSLASALLVELPLSFLTVKIAYKVSRELLG